MIRTPKPDSDTLPNPNSELETVDSTTVLRNPNTDTDTDTDSPAVESEPRKRRKRRRHHPHHTTYRGHPLDFRVIPFSSQPERLLSVIIPRFLYLSDIYAARNTTLLERVGITHVISCLDLSKGFREHFELGLKIHIIPVNDTCQTNLYRYFERAVHFIHTARNDTDVVTEEVTVGDTTPEPEPQPEPEGRKLNRVLVHCWGGVSRSVSIVAAYLMFRTGLGYHEVFDLIRDMRPEACPNRGFREQLKRWESDLVEMRSEKKRREERNQTRQVPEGETEEGEGETEEEEEGETEEDQEEIKGYCHRCRFELFRQSEISQHDPQESAAGTEYGRGAAGASGRPNPRSSSTLDFSDSSHRFSVNKQKKDQRAEYQRGRIRSKRAIALSGPCESFFFAIPLEWMELTVVGAEEGTLNCPKCSSKLGSFKWRGSQCSCGRWMVPSLQILKSRVDYFKLKKRRH